MTPGEVRRLYFIIRTFLSYGFGEPIPKTRIVLPLRLWRYSLFRMSNRHKGKPLGERSRLVLQELGPARIKLRQMPLTCRDLPPPHITDQLALLQDWVALFDGFRAKKQVEKATGGLPVREWFGDFEIMPLASASAAQAHTAQPKSNGKEVAIKAIRLDTLPVIKADLKLIYHLARWVPRLLPNGCRLRLTEVVRKHGKTLIDELNLLRESTNAIQLRRNFEDSPMLYIPEVYSDYCSQSMMVTERIYSIPVSNVTTLEKNGTNMKLLVERDIQVLFTQASCDSFFHVDMHPGNIFVSYKHPESSKYTGIDCGIVGSLNKEDKCYLAENSIAFFNRDYRKVVELHVDSGWVPPDTNIEKFELAIRTVCEPIFEKPLAEISFGHVLLNLFNTARRLSMEVQPQLVLLQKTLLYVEGVGRQLYLQLDSWKVTKPFPESQIKDQAGILVLVRVLKEKAPFWVEKMSEMSELVYDGLRQGKYLQYNVDKITREPHANHVRQGQSRYLLGIDATSLLSGTFLLISRPEWGFMSGWLVAGGVIAWLIGWHKMR